MRQGKDLIGKTIISISDGRVLGSVKDIYVNSDLNWMTGIHLGAEGLIRRKSLLISRDDVVVFGMDAILVKHADVVSDDKQRPEAEHWLRLDKLRGREIDTPGGTKVGSIGDIIIDGEGNIVSFVLARVFVEGPIAQQRSIGRDTIIDTGREDGVMTVDLAKAEGQQEVTEEVEEDINNQQSTVSSQQSTGNEGAM